MDLLDSSSNTGQMLRSKRDSQLRPMIETGKATLADGKRIAEIQVAGWKAGYRGILPDGFLDRLNPEPRASMWERFIQTEEGLMLVARSFSELVGFCHLIPSRDADGEHRAEIAALYVHPDHWRSGCGRRLFEVALASAAEQGYAGITLWVLTENSRGRGFYEAMGMQPDGAMKVEDGPGCALHEVRYRIELSACGSS
ncbi:MAG: GNAT family N-acetyltransferase [Verrucomicrobiaceae bacterium]|nr:MAG: GNAT family N-acetyltransferase [Verrucomicrobiaceae bacterium]